jgi:hypothetical protein
MPWALKPEVRLHNPQTLLSDFNSQTGAARPHAPPPPPPSHFLIPNHFLLTLLVSLRHYEPRFTNTIADGMKNVENRRVGTDSHFLRCFFQVIAAFMFLRLSAACSAMWLVL